MTENDEITDGVNKDKQITETDREEKGMIVTFARLILLDNLTVLMQHTVRRNITKDYSSVLIANIMVATT